MLSAIAVDWGVKNKAASEYWWW